MIPQVTVCESVPLSYPQFSLCAPGAYLAAALRHVDGQIVPPVCYLECGLPDPLPRTEIHLSSRKTTNPQCIGGQLAFHLHPDCHRDDTTTLLSFPGFCKRRIPKTNVSTWREAAIANKADADRLTTELAAAAPPPDPIRPWELCRCPSREAGRYAFARYPRRPTARGKRRGK